MGEERQTGKYPIGTVARVTGLSTHTLRVWERRYGVVVPARTRGGMRAYSDADIDKLLLLKRLTVLGHPIGHIAHLPLDELRIMSSPETLPGPSMMEPSMTDRLLAREAAETIRRKFTRAVEALDLSSSERLLLQAASMFEPRELVLHVIAPLLDEIGTRWAEGSLRIVHEHAASALLRNLLGTMLRASPQPPGGAIAVAATPAGELHELGLLMASFLAVLQGWRVTYLGTSLPAGELLHAVEQSGAAVVLLSIVNAHDEDTARELEALGRGLPADVQLMVGGRGVPAYAGVLGRAWIVGDLTALEPLLGRYSIVHGTKG